MASKTLKYQEDDKKGKFNSTNKLSLLICCEIKQKHIYAVLVLTQHLKIDYY